ncbi:hypothetical protein CNMCM6936_008995 [Aspergillus lentulus]|nr:hypothetical protein CNMCM6936_008995 [Aspergillus lentulus]KAF4175664.1 hypothetical protein CNMCM8060_007155 [Aspergillus lentulus]KAF4184663.1 hypothetical protein CNMCM7927_007717 [Aspergillus lentulus]KAF4194586.1 hypothetical protein CNMCM8694_007299 [Aspergillus lentulus]
MPPKQAKGEYIETDTGNKISRRSQIHGTQHIILGGKTVIQADAVIRGDLYRSSSSSSSSTSADGSSRPSQPSTPSVAITIGRYSYISRQAVLRPPSRLHRGGGGGGGDGGQPCAYWAGGGGGEYGYPEGLCVCA